MSRSMNNLLIHLTALLMFAVRELINDLSHSDENNENLPEKFLWTTTVLQSTQRYAYLKKIQTLKIFFTILNRLTINSPRKLSSTIPDAPPLPADILPTTTTAAAAAADTPSEDTFGISSLFDESTAVVLTNTTASVAQTSFVRSLSISSRKRTILNRCLETDLCSEDYFDQDDLYDLLNYLDKNYFNENHSILLNDLKDTLNNKEQIENLAHLIQQSMPLPRFIHNLIQHEILTHQNEDLLLEYLSISFEQSWPVQLPINTLIVFLKFILKRQNSELICLLWQKFLDSLSNDIALEHLQIFLIFFHQLTNQQRKTILLQLVDKIQSQTKPNLSLLILFEYMMFNFYEISIDIIENIQQLISKIDATLTFHFNQIVSKNNSNYLDSFALKTLYNSSIYNRFYDYLIKQLDFTRINKEDLTNTAIKQYYDLLWRILGYLPPSNEFLEQMNTYTDTTHLLHLFRLEKRILQDKHITEFLAKEISFKDIQWFQSLTQTTHSTFDLIVYQILLQNLSSTSDEINRFYEIFVQELKHSLNINSSLEYLSIIPINKPTIEPKTSTIPTLPNDFDELFTFQLNSSLEQTTTDLSYIFLRQILQILLTINSEIDNKQLYILIQLDGNLQFLKEQIKLKNINNESIQNDIYEYIYKTIFEILFNINYPNEILTEEIYHDLIKYLDEQFQPTIFQQCLAPHDLFDLLYLTAQPNHSLSIFARMLMLFNKIFSYSNQFPQAIEKLNRIANLSKIELAQWLSKLVLPPPFEQTSVYTPEQCKHVLETFTKYLIRKHDNGTPMINENVSISILQILIELGNELRQADKFALGFPQIIQLLVILAGHGSGNGHGYLFQAAIQWLQSSTEILTESDQILRSTLSIFHSNLVEASVYLLSYINDILFALKYLSLHESPSSFDSDESNNDDDDDDDDNDNSNAMLTFDETKKSSNDYDPNKLCTYTTTKKEYANQHWYHCHTCKMIERVGICQICANVCHRDHDISYAKYGSFFCDCGAQEDGSCQALVKRPAATTTNPIPTTSIAKKKTIKTTNKKSTKLTNRQRRLIRQINSKQQEFHSCLQTTSILSNTFHLFQTLQPYIDQHYQQIYNIENKFDLISEFLKGNSIVNDENKQSIVTGLIHSQDNAFEHVKLSFTNEHGQQIKQLLSTNSIRRQGMCLIEHNRQHLVVSQEKGKQSMITIVQLNSLLKQANLSIDNSAKKKINLTKLNSINVPFTILSMQPNQLNPDYIALTGLKDCHIFNIDQNGQLKEPTIILQPNLDSTGNYIIKSQWIANRNQTQLALLTADFIKIYDLHTDTISPIYHFILPTGKVRDCTFYYTKRNNIDYCYILIMASNGYIYYEQLSDSSSAKNGSFYVTNTLDIKHESITETNNNGILLGGGVSVYYSSTLKLLFWSYVHGKNFYGLLDENNIEKLLLIRSIDVKMTTNGSNKPTLTYHTLCSWSEVAHHPGLIYTMTQMTTSPVVLMITPTNVAVNEIKIQLKTSKIQDIVGIRYDQRTNFLLLADDGSLKMFAADQEKTNYWLEKISANQRTFSMIDFDLNEDMFEYESNNSIYPLSDNETDDQQEPTVKRRKSTITNTNTNTISNESSSGTVKFPVDFFETCHILTEYEFGGKDLLDVYNVAQLKLRLSTPGMFVANVRTTGFTLEITNKDSDNMVITGVRIHVGGYSLDKCPQYFEYFGRNVQVNSQQGARWYDLCLTREESIQAEKKLAIFVAQSLEGNHVTVIDDVKVYGKSKEEFQWPDDVESTLAVALNTNLTTNEYLHSFRQTNDEKQLLTLAYADRLLVYSMQILTNSLALHHHIDRQQTDVVQSISHMLQLSLPNQIQRYAKDLLKETLSSTDCDYHEHIDRLQLNFLAQCFSLSNYLELFHNIQTYEYLLLSLLSIARHRPHNINRYFILNQQDSRDAISKNASMQIFISYLVNIFLNLLDQRPTNSLLESLDNPQIEFKQIEKLLNILVDIYYSLALNEPQLCMNLIVDSYIRLLTYRDYQINFLLKNALNRCMQPKIQRLISKLSTASDLNTQQQQPIDRQFQSLPLSAQIYPTEEQARPRWTDTPPINPVQDENAMLQYALALSMTDEVPPPPPPAATTTNIDSDANQSENNSLDEGDDGHVSESSSSTETTTTNNNDPTSTPVLIEPTTNSSPSNDSNTTIKLNLNESIDSTVYEQRLYDFKHLIVQKLLDNLETNLLQNRELNGVNAIAYLQLLLTLTIEFASKSDEDNRNFVRSILKRLLGQMTFLKDQPSIDELIQRTAQHEIQLMLLRLFTVYVSFMLKVRMNERDQYLHLSLTAAKELDQSNLVHYCLHALKIVYQYLQKQSIDESPSNDLTTYLKIHQQQHLPDLSPFFYKQYTKHHANDVFESYPELLAEIATRLPYQMKKVFDTTMESRSFLLSNDWQTCLCEYYILPQANFLKRQIRKLLMYICGSRDKYRKLRDLHVLSTNLDEIKQIYDENHTRKFVSTQIPYVTLMQLVDHLKTCQDISVQRPNNWQNFCKTNPTILKFFLELIMFVDDSLAPFILHLLINSISSPTSRTLKTSKSTVRPTEHEPIDDLSSCSIALQFMKLISFDLLEQFIRIFLLENPQQTIRWLTHTFLYHLYTNSNKQIQEQLFDLFIQFWSNISCYGLKAFQYVDLLGYIIIKSKDDKRTNEFLPKLESLLKLENQYLLNHPNASIYRRLSSIIDIEQNNGYYFEIEPCLVCNNPDIAYQQVKLQTIKLDQRFTTQSHIIKLTQAYSIQKLQIKMSDIKRHKAVRTIRFYYNNRQVQSIVDLKNSVNCKWLLAKTIKLNNIQQTEVKIDFVIPIIACNLMIEYVDFFETNANASAITDTAALQCPRCNSAVAATPGICPNCGENVFQCHKCRSINYDERDPFLCNSCGYCKYCKFDFIFTAKQINYVEPIESDDDRTKTLTNISQLLEKIDKIYRQLFNQKPILEFLLAKLTSDEQTTTTTIIPSTAAAATTTVTNTDNTDGQQQPTPQQPPPTTTVTLSTGINRIVQQIAPKYNTECRQTYDELGKYIQKIICARKELQSYDQRLTSHSYISTANHSKTHQCYGCILSTISHCILLLLAFVSSSNRFKQIITNNMSLIDELLLNNIRYTNQQIRHDVRLLFCHLTRDNTQLTDYITTKISMKIERFLNENTYFSSAEINYDLLVLYSLIQRSNQDDQDLCWEIKLRSILKLFLQSLQNTTPQVLEMITLPCLRMLLHLSKSPTTNSSTTKLVSVNIDEFLSKKLTYQDWLSNQDRTLTFKRMKNSWLEKLIFCPQSATIRFYICKLIQTLCTNNEKQKFFILQILLDYLHLICNENLSKFSIEYVQLIKDLLANDNQLKTALCNDEQINIIEYLANLIENEISIINKQDERNLSNSNLTFGYSIKCLTEFLTLFLQQDEFKQKYKSILIAIVLNGYLTLKKFILQRTKLIDEAQIKMLELLEQMTRGNEQETRQFMMICIDTIERFQLDDMQTPQFIFERLCNLIYPEETMQDNKEFFIVVEKDPNQEDFLQGRMMGNPYSSNNAAMSPLMRDIKNKICTDCELIALLEDDNGMELLVANKIINLGLTVRDVYKKVWLPYINSHQTSTGDTQQNDQEPMHIVYRMRGLLGDATEDIIETFDTKKNAGENGEDDPEDVYRLAEVLSQHSGLETMLKRLDSINDMSSGKALLQILLKLFDYAIKLKVNRQRLIDPKLRSISSMLNKLNLLLKTEIEEQGRDQVLLALTEKLLFIMDQLFHEASTTLSQDKYNEFSVSCEGDIEQLRSLLNYIRLPFVKSHPSLMQALIHLLPYLSFGNKEKMQTLLDYFKSYLEFDRFDLEQTSTTVDNDNQLHLDCFCEICKHLDKKSIYGKEFRDLVNESNGIIDQCIKYIESNSPQVKTYLGMQDQDSWKEFLNKPSLSYVLRLLTGLSYGHGNIQIKIGQSLIPILHKIEQLTTAGRVGVLAEDLLHSLTENEEVAKKIDDVRNQTRAEKKRLAQEARDRKMRELKLPRNKSLSESHAGVAKTPLAQAAADLTEETGHVCCICREGYKYFPNKVLAIYTFTKKVDIEPFENKTRKTSGYSSVTHFNIIHIDCHTSAIKQARSRDEWESALLQNANTRCNGLLPLWGPDVAEAQFTTALARYDTNIIEATGIRETSPTLSIHDIKLLLLRFADVQSFSEDTGGGGRESNIRLIPYQMHAILYVLTTYI